MPTGVYKRIIPPWNKKYSPAYCDVCKIRLSSPKSILCKKHSYTLDRNLKLSISLTGRKLSQSVKDKISNSKKGIPLSKDHIEKLRLSCIKRNVNPPHYSGPAHPRWIEDRTKIKQYWTERNNPEYKQWRMAVWKRDGFKCRISSIDCGGRIEAHHILGWTEHPELNYQINNGITLCHAHHPRKRAEEKRLIPFFKELVSVSN